MVDDRISTDTADVPLFESNAIQDEVNLGNQGLTEGDLIDPYIEEFLEAGVRVVVPSGRYVWDGSGLHKSDNEPAYQGDCILIGDGMVTLEWEGSEGHRSNVRLDSGTLRMRNFTFVGDIVSGPESDDHTINPMALSSGAVIEFINVHQPEGNRGQAESEASAWYVGRPHDGTVRFLGCSAEWFGNNAIYASSPGKDGQPGRVEVIGCYLRNNNITGVRVGGGEWLIKDTVIVNDELAPSRIDSGRKQRGIRFDEPGGPGRIENVHITSTVDNAPPIAVSEDGEGGQATVQDLFIENGDETGFKAIEFDGRSYDLTGDNIHLTGDGDLDIDGGPYTNVFRGSDAQSPLTEPIGDWGGGDIVTRMEFEVEGKKTNSPPPFDYEFDYWGEVVIGNETESANRTQNDDGSQTMHSSWAADDAIYDDNYWVKGQITDFRATAPLDQINLYWGGSTIVHLSDFPLTSPGFEPPEPEPPDEPEPEPDPIPDRAQIAITGGGTGNVTSYIFEVDGDVANTYGLEADDTVVGDGITTLSGHVAGRFDGFDYTGCIRRFAWNGAEPTVFRDGSEIPLSDVVDCEQVPDDPFLNWIRNHLPHIAVVGGSMLAARELSKRQ